MNSMLKSSKPRSSVLSRHPKAVSGRTPDMSYVERYVDRDAENGNHWFFRDTRRNHRHNRAGHPLLSWSFKVPGHPRQRLRGEYCVTRLMIEAVTGPIEPYTRFTSVCGLSQCVNPDHWRRRVPPPTWTIRITEGGYWEIVRHKHETPLGQERLLGAIYAGAIHSVRAFPGVHNPNEPLVALCGEQIPAMLCAVTRGSPTCTKGC